MPGNKVEARTCNVYELDKSSKIQRRSHLSRPFSGNFPVIGGITCSDQQALKNECTDSPTLTTNSEQSDITEASGDYNFYTMQQPGFNDTQPLHLQQYMMLKQLQEFQRQQQLGDLREPSPLNRFSVSPGTQWPPLINGTPVHNWMQPVVPGKVMFPQEQGQALRSVGLSQELDASVNGAPVSNARASMSQSQYPIFQGMVPGGQTQSSGYGNSLGDLNAFSGLQMKSNYGQVPVQGLNAGQEQGVWPESQPEKQFGGSALDPLEAKILYNMDDGNIWDAFGSQTDTGTLENADSSAFQCGTWSALMQSAVAESDTGLQEEWSGLTFQNTELSTDNLMATDSTTGSTFPGFPQPEIQSLGKQGEDLRNDNYNPQKPAVQNDNAWVRKMFEHSQSASKHKQGVSSSISDDGMGNSQHQMSNDPHVTVNSHKGAHELQEKLQNQLYAQSSSSHGFGLGLAPPSQKVAYPNGVLMPARSQQAVNNLNSRHDLGERTQARDTPFSLPSQESGFPGPSSLSPYVNLQGTSIVTKSQSQIHPSQSSHTFSPGSMSQFSPLNQMASQDLGNAPSHHSNLSGLTPQSEKSASPYNVWRNVPFQRPQLSNFPSMESANNDNRSSSSWAPHVPVDRSAEVGTSSDKQSHNYGKEQLHNLSNIPDASSGVMPQGQEPISDVTTPNYGLPIIHAEQRQNNESTSQQKYGLLQQVQATLASSVQVSSPLENQVAVARPKKRKFMAIELVPWHKEVTQQPKRLQIMSVAEQDWAQVTNRLIEKVEVIEALHRSRRRLVLTTQLVQQLLRPAPASIFSADAATNYDMILYFVSRLSLGDACSLSYYNSSTNSEKPKSEFSSEKLLEVGNNFSSREKQLEDEFERLDKTASIAIIRAEIAELERFAVINRFAKFHVRGKNDATSSSSGVPTSSPQRRIIAVPVPQYIPDGVQCLSL